MNWHEYTGVVSQASNEDFSSPFLCCQERVGHGWECVPGVTDLQHVASEARTHDIRSMRDLRAGLKH